MHIILNDQSSIKLDPVSNPVEPIIRSMFKHLQHVPLEFRPWDNPYYISKISYNDLVEQLIELAGKLDISVDRSRCFNRDDAYYNYLHKIYETNYDGKPIWLDFHENIHLCQRYYWPSKRKATVLDWREKAGPLIKEFNVQWLEQHSTMKVKKGDVYVEWNELGKTPWQYWKEQEPDDATRLLELVKPWNKLRPKLNVAMQDIDFESQINSKEFLAWWNRFKDQWCRHHNLLGWNLEHASVIVVYKIVNFEDFDQALQQCHFPTRVVL